MSTTQPSAQEYLTAARLRAGLRTFWHESESLLLAEGLTVERYELLLAIKAGADGQPCVTVSELSVALGVAASSVTQLVRRVEDAGFLRREVSSTDARVRYLRLTVRGERALANAVVALRKERAQLVSALGQV